MIASYFYSAAIGYFLGSFHIAYILGKKVGHIDIRKHGSNNSGASNVTRVLGWKYGIITAIVDILKAALAVILIRVISPGDILLPFIAGAFAVLGHIFPVLMGFKGGKGAACIGGFMLGFDWRISLILLGVIITVTILTDYIALGTIAMAILLPVLLWLFGYPKTCIYISGAILLLVIFKHYINFVRIAKGEEIGLRAVAKRR